MGAPARDPEDATYRGRAAFSGSRSGDPLRDRVRVGDDERLQGPAAGTMAVHQGAWVSRDDHSEGVWRPRLFRLCAFAGDHEALDTLRHGGRDGARAEFARPGRTAAPLRHRRAEALLPAAACT